MPDDVTARRQRFAAFWRTASLAEVAATDVSTVHGAHIAATESVVMIAGVNSKQLPFRAQSSLVGSLLYAQQLLRDGRPTSSGRDYVIDCLNRAIRWEDTWAEPVAT